jgi:hypothetical protein
MKMKTIQLLAAALMFITACTKENDEVNPSASTQPQNQSGAKVTAQRAFGISLSSSPNTGPTPTTCSGDLQGFAIGDLFLGGAGTHVGQMNSTQSTLHHTNCNMSFSTALLTAGVSGQVASSTGDLIYYTGNDVINVVNLLTGAGSTGAITGVWTITGGTGRFAGATGSFEINGSVDFTNSTFTAVGVGTITY